MENKVTVQEVETMPMTDMEKVKETIRFVSTLSHEQVMQYARLMKITQRLGEDESAEAELLAEMKQCSKEDLNVFEKMLYLFEGLNDNCWAIIRLLIDEA